MEKEQNKEFLDETMVKSLNALDKLLETYSKEEFKEEMKKYENTEYLNYSINLRGYFHPLSKGRILCYYDGPKEFYDSDNNIFCHWIKNTNKKELWFIVFSPDKKLIDKYFTNTISPKEIITSSQANTYIGMFDYDSIMFKLEIVQHNPITQTQFKYLENILSTDEARLGYVIPKLENEKVILDIKDDKFVFVNFFASNIDDSKEERKRVESLECELDREYDKYDLNSMSGRISRTHFAAQKNILYVQLGNTTTNIYKIDDDIIGVDYQLDELLSNHKDGNIEENIKIFKENMDIDDDTEMDDEYKEIIDLYRSFANKKIQYFGNICNEMWRIMGAEPRTIEKHSLKEDHYNSPVEVDIIPGKYELKCDNNRESSLYFHLLKID